jgi:hypothetical protein
MSEAQSFEMSVDKLVSAGHSLWLAGLGAVAGMEERARELRKLVEDTVEYETKGVLKRLGLPTCDDVKLLAARLDTLAKRIDEISTRQEIDAMPATRETKPKTRKTAAAKTERRPRQRKN